MFFYSVFASVVSRVVPVRTWLPIPSLCHRIVMEDRPTTSRGIPGTRDGRYFYLVKTAIATGDNPFKIYCGSNITCDNVIHVSGDASELEKMMKQLSQTCSWLVSLKDMNTVCDMPGKKSKYQLRESEEDDVYATDEDAEYQPKSGSSSSSSSSNYYQLDRREQLRNIYLPKRRLFTNTSFEAYRGVDLVPNDRRCNQSCLDVVKKVHSDILISPIDVSNRTPSECRISSASSATDARPLVNFFQINLDTSWVTMTINIVLHESVYECNLVQDEQQRLGFLNPTIPDKDHECTPINSDLDRTLIIIVREPNTSMAQIRVAFCTPLGRLQGDEIYFPDELKFRAPLKMRNAEPVSSLIKMEKKKHCCLYCRKKFIEMTSHLYRVHKGEKEVMEIMKMDVNSKERNNALRNLRLKGDDLYNKQVAPENRIVLKRFTKTSMRSSVKCPQCLATLASKNFARHERRCTGRRPNRRQVLRQARDLERLQFKSTHNRQMQERVVENLMKHLKLDIIRHEVVSDLCLKLATERYAFMHRSSPTALRNDRQHLRCLARLLLTIKDMNPSILDFEDVIVNCDYDVLLNAVYKLCALDEETGDFGKPSFAKVLRSLITFVLESLKNHYVAKRYSEDTEEWKGLIRFQSLHDKNYGIYVGRTAHRATLVHKALSKRETLPSPNDVKLFSKYIDDQAKAAYQILSNNFSYDAWLRLGKAELVKIIVFNRRRVSEVASMLLNLYNQKIDLTEQEKNRLTVLERSLAEEYKIMTIIGKREHILHILLDRTQCRHLDLFLRYRGEAGVCATNKYLFGVPTVGLYIDASVALREFSAMCGANEPRLLRTTYLRKQVATLAQLLSMNDSQIAQVAKLMGHSQKVHENVYRQDERLFQVTAWAKFLTLVNDEDLTKYKGKSFDEIVNIANAMEEARDNPGDEDYIRFEELLDQPEFEVETTPEVHYITDAEAGGSHDPECSYTIVGRETSGQSHTHREVTTPKKSHKPITPQKSHKPTTPKKSHKQTTPKKSPTIAQILHQLSPMQTRKRTRVRFSDQETQIMKRVFTHHLSRGILPKLSECSELIASHRDIFSHRCGRDIYNWVQYQRNKSK